MAIRERDYALTERVSKWGDDVLINVIEAAAITGLSPNSIQQRRIRTFPQPVKCVRRLKWRLGEVRAWMRTRDPAPETPEDPPPKHRGGRPRLPIPTHSSMIG